MGGERPWPQFPPIAAMAAPTTPSDAVGRGYVPDGSWFGLWFADRTRSPSAQRLRIRRGCRGRSPDLRADPWASRTGDSDRVGRSDERRVGKECARLV